MFVVKTQILENYGAHSADGKFSNGNAYWKMKGGNEYIVNDVERPQDAMAFIAAKYMVNDLYCKEFPIEAITWKEWQNELMDLDEGYRAFLVENAIPVSPLQS